MNTLFKIKEELLEETDKEDKDKKEDKVPEEEEEEEEDKEDLKDKHQNNKPQFNKLLNNNKLEYRMFSMDYYLILFNSYFLNIF